MRTSSLLIISIFFTFQQFAYAASTATVTKDKNLVIASALTKDCETSNEKLEDKKEAKKASNRETSSQKAFRPHHQRGQLEDRP